MVMEPESMCAARVAQASDMVLMNAFPKNNANADYFSQDSTTNKGTAMSE
jgi:hypothetical protein